MPTVAIAANKILAFILCQVENPSIPHMVPATFMDAA